MSDDFRGAMTYEQTWKSLSANTLNSSGNLSSVKQSNTLIRVVSTSDDLDDSSL